MISVAPVTVGRDRVKTSQTFQNRQNEKELPVSTWLFKGCQKDIDVSIFLAGGFQFDFEDPFIAS